MMIVNWRGLDDHWQTNRNSTCDGTLLPVIHMTEHFGKGFKELEIMDTIHKEQIYDPSKFLT